jgi:hypothetical protein
VESRADSDIQGTAFDRNIFVTVPPAYRRHGVTVSGGRVAWIARGQGYVAPLPASLR